MDLKYFIANVLYEAGLEAKKQALVEGKSKEETDDLVEAHLHMNVDEAEMAGFLTRKDADIVREAIKDEFSHKWVKTGKWTEEWKNTKGEEK